MVTSWSWLTTMAMWYGLTPLSKPSKSLQSALSESRLKGFGSATPRRFLKPQNFVRYSGRDSFNTLKGEIL